MQNGVMVHLCHVSGERMKAQGLDGLSRGNLNVGVMAGTAMLDFVLTHLNAFERSSTLLPWCYSGAPTGAFSPLEVLPKSTRIEISKTFSTMQLTLSRS